MVNKPYYDILDIKNWEIEKAINTNDIIWSELNKGYNRSTFIKIIAALIPFIVSIVVILSLSYVD